MQTVKLNVFVTGKYEATNVKYKVYIEPLCWSCKVQEFLLQSQTAKDSWGQKSEAGVKVL